MLVNRPLAIQELSQAQSLSLARVWLGLEFLGVWGDGRRKGVREEVREVKGVGVSRSEMVTEPNEFPHFAYFITFHFYFILLLVLVIFVLLL